MSFFRSKVRKIIFIDIILYLFGLAGIYQIAERAGINPTTHIEFTSSQNKLIVENIYAKDMASLFQAGDTLVAINGFEVETADELEMITDSESIGSISMVVLARNGKTINTEFILPPFYKLSYLIIVAFVGGLFFFLGVFVILKKPVESAAQIYHWVSVSVALIIMTTWGRYTIDPLGMGHVIRVIFYAAYVFTPVLFVHFSLVFPKKKLVISGKIVTVLYILAGILLLWAVYTFLFATLLSTNIESFRQHLIAFDSIRWFFASCIILGVATFVHSMLTAADGAELRKLLWIIIGMIIGPLCFISLWQIPQALGYLALVPEEIIILISSIMPITFTISIVKYHIMEIDHIARRSTVYLIAITLLLTLYILIITIAMTLIDTFTTKSSLITSAVAAIILALLFEPVRKKTQKFVDKKFFRIRYDYRLAQRKFSEEMNLSVDIKSLSIFIVDKLEELLKPNCIALLLSNEENNKLITAAHNNCDHFKDTDCEKLRLMVTKNIYQVMALEGQIEPGIVYTKLDKQFDDDIALILPIRNQDGVLSGLMFLGRKQSDFQYTLEDIDLLKTVISQLGLSIDRIRLQNKLLLKQEETRRLDELTKMQSFFISSVSHDLQTPLTSIKMYIDLLKQKKNITSDKLNEYLSTVSGESDRLSRLIHNVLDVSRMQRGVKLYQSEQINLNRLIEKVMHSMQYQLDQYGFKVDIRIPGNDIHIIGDEDSLSRAITNIISNAIKYSKKDRQLKLRLFTQDINAGIEISDKGIGIPTSEQKKIFNIFYRSSEIKIQSIGGAGLGLAIVSHVIQAHKGHIDLKSAPGSGSTFTLWIPLYTK